MLLYLHAIVHAKSACLQLYCIPYTLHLHLPAGLLGKLIRFTGIWGRDFLLKKVIFLLAGKRKGRIKDREFFVVDVILMHADMQTCRHADMQTCRHSDTQTCRHADMQHADDMHDAKGRGAGRGPTQGLELRAHHKRSKQHTLKSKGKGEHARNPFLCTSS
jgi:hypothetical protein